jgi:hypothetical protein
VFSWIYELPLHGASTDSQMQVESQGSTTALNACLRINADIVDAGLLVHLTQQLHQVLAIEG